VEDKKVTMPSLSVSRTKSAAIQFSGNMVLMLLSIIQGLLLVPLYLHYLGGYLYGAWLALAGSVLLFGMADMGISSLVIQKCAVFHSKKDFRSLAKLVGTMRVINTFTIVLIVIGAAILIPIIPKWLNILPQYHSILIIVAWLTVIDLALMLLVNVSGSFLLGIQNPAPHMSASIAAAVLVIFVVIGMLFGGFGVLALSVGALVRPLIVLPSNLYSIRAFLASKQVLPEVMLDKQMFKDLLSKSLWLGPSKIAETITGQIDSIIIAKVLGPGSVTVLSVSRKAADLSVQIVGRISASLLSGLSHLHGSGQKDIQQQVVKTLFKVVGYAAGIGLGGFLIFNEKFVSLWVGAQYYGGTSITLLVCFYSVLKVCRISLYNIVFSIGEITLSAKSTVVEVALQTTFGFFLCIKLGLPGVVLGAIMGVMCATGIQFGKMFAANVIDKTEFGFLCFKISSLLCCFILPAYLINKNVVLSGWGGLLSGIGGYLIISLSVVVLAERELSLRLSRLVISQMRAVGQRS